MSSYRVGQVLYVVLRKEAKVYPLQVIEEITKKTLEGQETTYMVRGGPSTEQPISIDQIDGEVFDSADKLKRALTERATTSIAHRVEQATVKAREWYPTGFESSDAGAVPTLKKPAQKLKPPKPPKLAPVPQEVSDLASELQQDAEKLEVMLPDGTLVRARGNIKLPDALGG